MSASFLPKDFDTDIDADYCSDYQYGKNSTAPHWHSGAEIIFVVKGKVGVMFDNSWHVLEENSMLFIPPKQLHCCKCDDSSAEKIVIGFTEKCLGKGGVGLSLPNNVNQHCIFHNLESSNLPSLIESFNRQCVDNKLYSKDLIAKAFLFQIYAYLIEYWNDLGLNVNSLKTNKTASYIYEYIENHFMEELSPYDVAKKLHISYSCLAKTIQKFSRTSFIRCVNQVRVENAKRLLVLTEKNVTEIGLECGFSVTSYFIKTFHQFTQMTPKAYRNLIKKSQIG